MATSRFFAKGDSSDESDRSDSGSEDESNVASHQLGGAGQQLNLVYSSSESEEEKRTIRSAKDKAFEHIQATTKALRNHLKISDYTSVTKDWEALGKQMDKARNVVAKEGVPDFYLQTVAILRQHLDDTFANKEEVKKMSTLNAKALSALRSKVKKQTAISPLSSQLDNYLAKHPLPAGDALAGDAGSDDERAAKKKGDDSDESSDSDEDEKPKRKKPAAKKKAESSDSESSDSDDDRKKKPAAKGKAKKADSSSESSSSSDSDSESSDSDDSSDSSDESSDSDESSMSDDSDAAEAGNAWFTREFWLKKEYKKGYKGPAPKPVKEHGESDDSDLGSDADDASEDSGDEEKEELAEKRRQQHADRAAKKLKEREKFDKLREELTRKDAEDEQKAQQEELKPEQVLKRLKDLLALRGKRGTDVHALIHELKSLRQKSLKVASAPALLKLNVTLMASLFDLSLNKSVKNKASNKDVSIASAAASATGVAAPADQGSNNASEEFMNIKSWKEACDVLGILLNQLNNDATIALSEDEKRDETFLDEDLTKRVGVMVGIDEEEKTKMAAEQQQILSPKAAAAAAAAEERRQALLAGADPDDVQYVVGSLLGFIQSLCREYTKSLLHIDPHSLDYIERLKHEQILVDLVARVQEYYARLSASATAETAQSKRQMEAKVVLLRLELLYYRYHADLDVLKASVEANAAAAASAVEKKATAAAARAADVQTVVPQLSQFLYKHGDQKARTRGLLMHVFWLALHSRYTESRELLLMSHLHENVHDLGMKTRILYNRALAMLGLCAFKHGEFRQSLDALAELHQSNKIKELLAQGVSMNRWQERDLEEEEMHRRRQYPYHQHLNLDSLEAVHLLCAMLLEVPNLALHGTANKRRILSRLFRRMWEHHQRQAFSGPAETTRDLIMNATKSLSKGDWEACSSSIRKLRLWDSLKSNSGEAVKAHIQSLLLQRVKEEALRTYLITFSQHFLHMSHAHLAAMFALDEAAVQKIASSLMVNEQLQAAWDEPAKLLVIEETQTNKLQKSAVAFTEKALVFLDQNERLLDSRPQDRERRERAERAEASKDATADGAAGGERRGALAGRFRGGGRGGGRGGRGRGGRGGGGDRRQGAGGDRRQGDKK